MNLRLVTAGLLCLGLALSGCGPQDAVNSGSTMPGSTPAKPSASALPRLDTSEGKDTSRGHNDPDGLWAQAERDAADELIDDVAELREHQRNWRRAVESDFPPGGDITVDPRTFMPLQELMVEGFGVTGPNPALLKSPDPTLLREALRRATERILRVRADGRELSESQVEGRGEADDDEGDEEGETDDDYMPNYLSEPEGYTGVVGISNFDTKGVVFVWLERTTLRIVAEELRRSGAVPARIVPYLDVDTLAWLREHGETYPSDAELR